MAVKENLPVMSITSLLPLATDSGRYMANATETHLKKYQKILLSHSETLGADILLRILNLSLVSSSFLAFVLSQAPSFSLVLLASS